MVEITPSPIFLLTVRGIWNKGKSISEGGGSAAERLPSAKDIPDAQGLY